MSKNLYVGNLPFQTTADDLRDAFSQYGTVTSAQVISDRETGRSRGFGFVEMSDGGEAAIEAMNGAELQGRSLTVNEARPREARAAASELVPGLPGVFASRPRFLCPRRPGNQ
jgi:cold-inducible RNA-binding protein